MRTKHEGELTRNLGGSPAAILPGGFLSSSSCTNAIWVIEGEKLGEKQTQNKVIQSHQSTTAPTRANQTRDHPWFWATRLLNWHRHPVSRGLNCTAPQQPQNAAQQPQNAAQQLSNHAACTLQHPGDPKPVQLHYLEGLELNSARREAAAKYFTLTTATAAGFCQTRSQTQDQQEKSLLRQLKSE